MIRVIYLSYTLQSSSATYFVEFRFAATVKKKSFQNINLSKVVTFLYVGTCFCLWCNMEKKISYENIWALPATFLLTVCTKKVCLLLAIWIYLLFVTWKSWLEKFFFYFWCILYIGTYMLYNQKRNWGFFLFWAYFFR